MLFGVRAVFAMATPTGALVTDTDAAFSATVPREMMNEFGRAFAAHSLATLDFGHARWTLTPTGSHVLVTATHNDKMFEKVLIEDPGAWSDVLRTMAQDGS